MHSTQLLSALAAVSLVAAQSKTCTKDIKVTEPTPIITCEVVDADVIVDPKLEGALSLEGIKQIKGDLILSNVSITSLSSTSINAIGGKFQLDSLQYLDTLRMDSLTNVGQIEFVNLNRLNGLTFGSTGVTKVKSIKISDTFLNDLSGLNVATVGDFLVNNNRRMTTFNSDLVNITGTMGLVLQGNGKDMELALNDLKMASELQFQDVKSIKVPSLSLVTQSLKLDGNENLVSFSAPNLTEVRQAVSFIDNRKLANVSLPKLTNIGGDLTVINNTAMKAVAGFPKLETVVGGIRMGGVFEEVELPSLQNVKGSANVTSTTDIKEFCDFFDKAKADGDIEGEEKCTSENDKALEGEDGGTENNGDSGSSDDSSSDEGDAAGIVNVNMAVLGLAVVFGVAQLL